MSQFKFIQDGDPDDIEDIANQSLVKRSRLILGEDVELGEAAPEHGTPRSPDPSRASAEPSKRREQVRQAQRTHRQRTQTYMKSLEKEVLRLRTAEQESMAQIERLQHQVDSLLSTLLKNKIPIPPGLEDEALLNSSLAGHGNPKSFRQVTLDPKDQSSLVSLGAQTGSGGMFSSTSLIGQARTVSQAVEPLLPTGDEECPSSFTPAGVLASDAQASFLHDPQIGIDFVLAYSFPTLKSSSFLNTSSLERPCLPHLRDSHLDHIFENGEGTTTHTHLTSGHLFTASLSLWQPTNPSRSKRESYNVSTAELNRLLQYSLNIPVDSNEVTPVQIWHRLKTLPLPPYLQVEFLGDLAEELIRHVKCLHFGAVIEIDTLNSTLSRVLERFPGTG